MREKDFKNNGKINFLKNYVFKQYFQFNLIMQQNLKFYRINYLKNFHI